MIVRFQKKFTWFRDKNIGRYAPLFLFVVFVCGGLYAPLVAHAQLGSIIGTLLSGLGSVAGQVVDSTVGGIVYIISMGLKELARFLMTGTGHLLDSAIFYSINSQNFKFEGLLNAWSVVRDVANMAFIFVLLYIGIMTILQLGSFSLKRVLITLIIVALLVNFSFFLAGVVIDAGNILAVTFYNSIVSGSDRTIGEIFSVHLQVDTLFNKAQWKAMSNSDAAFANIGIAIILFLTFFVFLSSAILFILRTVALVFVLLLSPFAFAAAAIPGTSEYFKKWLHYLINYSFVAPVYLLGLIIVLQVIPGMFERTPSSSKLITQVLSASSGSKSGDVSTLDLFLGYFIIAGLLIGVLVISRTIAGEMANLSVKWAGKATGFGMAGAAAIGRRTFGRGGSDVAQSEKLKNLEAQGGWKGKLAGLVRTGAIATSRASFDARGLGITRGAAGIVKTDFGRAGGRGGFEKIQREQIERKVRRAEDLARTTVGGIGERKLRDIERERRAEYESKKSGLEEKLSKDSKAKAELEEYKEKLKNAREEGNDVLIKQYTEDVRKRSGGVVEAEEKLAQATKNLTESRNKQSLAGAARAEQFARNLEGEVGGWSLMTDDAKREAVSRIRQGRTSEQKLLERLKTELARQERQNTGGENTNPSIKKT